MLEIYRLASVFPSTCLHESTPLNGDAGFLHDSSSLAFLQFFHAPRVVSCIVSDVYLLSFNLSTITFCTVPTLLILGLVSFGRKIVCKYINIHYPLSPCSRFYHATKYISLMKNSLRNNNQMRWNKVSFSNRFKEPKLISGAVFTVRSYIQNRFLNLNNKILLNFLP